MKYATFLRKISGDRTRLLAILDKVYAETEMTAMQAQKYLLYEKEVSRLSEKFDRIREEYLSQDDLPDDHQEESLTRMSNELAENCVDIISRIKLLVTETAASETRTKSNVRLPRIELPSFSFFLCSNPCTKSAGANKNASPYRDANT